MAKFRFQWGQRGSRIITGRKSRDHRIARDTQPAVINIAGYAIDQHSRERECARRLRQRGEG